MVNYALYKYKVINRLIRFNQKSNQTAHTNLHSHLKTRNS